ncbi:MAG: MCE family protein [Gemmatimonadales bacterium]|nr:MAG: MCE family protein [Gemmatimonadales bacterium]
MKRSREVLVGTVMLIGMIVVVIGSLWLAGSGLGRPSYPLEVLVADVGQLREGNQVKFRGVPIGRVDRFMVEPSGNGIRIHVLLDQEVPDISDAAAVVAPESLFGEWQVELVSRDRFPRFEYYTLSPGQASQDEPPLLPGFTLPDITRLTAAANEISQNLAVLTDRVDRAFNDETAENVRRAIDNVQDVSENLRTLVSSTRETFDDLRGDVSQATEDIGAAASVARAALERTNDLLETGQVDSIVTNVAEASKDLAVIARAVGSSSGEMQSAIMRMDSTFTRIDRMTARIESGEGVLGQLLSQGELLGQASSVLVQLDLLLADLRANPGRYVRLSIF